MLNEPVVSLKFIGQETAKKLNTSHIYTVKDLLNNFPKRYEDYIVDNSEDIYIGTIKTSLNQTSFRISKTTFKVQIGKTLIQVVAYRQPYLIHTLNQGDEVIIKGKFDKQKKILIINKIKSIHHKNRIEAQYDLPEIKDYVIRKAIHGMFDNNVSELFKTPYDSFIKTKNYTSLNDAYKNIHLPESYLAYEKGLKTIKLFDAIELLKKLKNKKTINRRKPLNIEYNSLQKRIKQLPFELTSDQINTLEDCLKDMNKSIAMERLIQGDVGSGKTIVGFLTAIMWIQKGYQVAMMAPTEILAQQHYDSFTSLFDISVVCLTSSTKDKRHIINNINNNQTSFIIGTHAIVSEDVTFSNLGLVIVDEQHKFGVNIRKQLLNKSKTKDLLYLTATPIPRSMIHVYYEQADVSIIQKMPSNRQLVTTKNVHSKDVLDIFKQLKRAVSHEQHAFVIVPSIQSERASFNIDKAYQLIHQITNDVYVLHGQMPKQEQQIALKKFQQSNGGILLSTSMIEVGINIPSATFMVVLDANFFGLAQLHQLRGRIGRGHLKGVCYLVSEHLNDERLSILESTNNGFEISEMDLKMRGPGQLFGLQQSGIYQEGHLNIMEDFPIIMDAKEILTSISKL